LGQKTNGNLDLDECADRGRQLPLDGRDPRGHRLVTILARLARGALLFVVNRRLPTEVSHRTLWTSATPAVVAFACYPGVASMGL
jgi:hypothetical protein